MSLPCSHCAKWPVLIRWWKLMSFIERCIGIVNPTIGFDQHSLCIRKATQSLHRLIPHLHRVHTEQFRVYTESTQSDSVSTQSLYRAIQGPYRVYTEWFGVYTESTQTGRFRVYAESKQIGRFRFYTEQFLVYTRFTQNDLVSTQSLYRVIQI